MEAKLIREKFRKGELKSWFSCFLLDFNKTCDFEGIQK